MENLAYITPWLFIMAVILGFIFTSQKFWANISLLILFVLFSSSIFSIGLGSDCGGIGGCSYIYLLLFFCMFLLSSLMAGIATPKRFDYSLVIIIIYLVPTFLLGLIVAFIHKLLDGPFDKFIDIVFFYSIITLIIGLFGAIIISYKNKKILERKFR